MRKALVLAGLAGAVLLVSTQRKDIARFLKIKQMSLGDGHPENVPASGSHRYPVPEQSALDESEDCISA